MLKKTITYEDYNGETQTEVVYFNLSKPELVELTIDGSFEKRIRAMIDAKDAVGVIAELKKIINMSYGVKSEDGKRFIKNPQQTEEFSQTAAYEALFMELALDADKAADFIIKIMPKDLAPEQGKPSLPPPPPRMVDL